VTQISTQLSSLLFGVRLLRIEKDGELTAWKEDVDSTQWLEFFQPFTHVRQVHLWRTQLVRRIVQALATEDMPTDILPELISLSLRSYHSSPYVAKAAVMFVAMRCASAGSRTVLCPCSTDSEKIGALGSPQEIVS
jgi:hypothetical protein